MPDPRLEALIQGYVEGTLSPEECDDLKARLDQDPAVARTIVEAMEMDQAIRDLSREQEESIARRYPAPQEKTPSRAVPRVRMQLSRARRSSSPVVNAPLLWGIAATLFFAILLGALLSSGPTAPPREHPPAARTSTPGPAPRTPAPKIVKPERVEARPAAPAVPSPTRDPRPEREVKSPEPRTPAPRTKPAPAPAPVRKPSTTVEAPRVLASIVSVQGSATLSGKPARAGDSISMASSIETDAGGTLTFAYPDGTKVELARLTRVRGFTDAKGKSFLLERGVLTADVAKQPALRPMAIEAPHGHARVVGTTFTLRAEAGFTRLDVTEGKVRLLRPNGVTSVLVQAGHYAIARPGRPLRAVMVPVLVARISFGPATAPVPEGYLPDTGAPFDPARGYGWAANRTPDTRLRTGSAPLLQRRTIIAGDSVKEARWEFVVPNGRYEVTLSCGGQLTSQGPHRASVEGVRVFNDIFTAKGEHKVAARVPVEVRDGRLTLLAGAVGSDLRAEDGTHDTILNYVVIHRVR